MAILVNGKKVAGVGIPGLSPYQVAKAGGYTGTEQEFNEALVHFPDKADKAPPSSPGNLAALDEDGNLIDSGKQVGEASGVASLDESGRVPAAQLPAMDYIPNAEKGAAGGVAPLGDDSKVPEQYLPATGAPADGMPTNDVRSYPVREGESINAGDVVNIGRRVISGTTFGSLEVGSTVQIKENGVPVDYLVVHQGLPSDMYDESCNGTWLLRKDIAEQRAWDAGNVNAYADSGINAYLNGDWMNRYDETTLENIKQVKIPYCVGNGDSSVKSGADGLSVRAFLLGVYELGFLTSDNQYFPIDGYKLSYFGYGFEEYVRDKRISKNSDGFDSTYHLRSAYIQNSNYICILNAVGGAQSNYSNSVFGVRPCIIYNSSALLDDSDAVYGSETVYRDMTAQANVEIKGPTVNPLIGTDCIKINDEYSLVAQVRQDTGSGIYIYSVLNSNGNTIKASSLSPVSGGYKTVSLYRLDDAHFIMQFSYGSALYALVGTIISNGSITLGSQYTVASSVSENSEIITLSETLAISIYNSSGLKCKVLPISGTTITTSGTVYSLSGNTGANYISACNLPDDSNGNKRVCICFADTSDSNKGKAVIATIDSSNAVTFGEVKTIATYQNTESKCIYINGIIYTFFTNAVYALSDDLNILGQTSISPPLTNISPATNHFTLVNANNNLIILGNHVSGAAASEFSFINETFEKSEAYIFNTGSANFIHATSISKNRFLLAYADAGNSNYGTATILEVSGNQIAGSFIDNSKDAIALESGEGGEIIKLGFGGYCKCPGVTTNQEIVGAGDSAVSAISPRDGWLWIDPQRTYGQKRYLPLSEASWEEIAEVSKAGLASRVYALGDTKDIELDGIGTMTLEIADFSHDYLSGSMDAERAEITFLCKNLLYQTYQMNSTDTNSGGFPSCAMYNTLNSTILNALPTRLKSVIKPIYKWYSTDYKGNGVWRSARLWVPLECELLGKRMYGQDSEIDNGARQYPIFTDNASRIKKMNNGAGGTQSYWLSSVAGATFFVSMGGNGSTGYQNASDLIGICFGFCV